MNEPFSIVTPSATETPLVVEVPHAGLAIDPETMSYLVAPIRSVARDADLDVDRVYDVALGHGATLLVAHMSRYVVDLNRSRDDFDGLTVEHGPERVQPRGVVWRLTTDGDPMLARRLPQAELARRLDRFYDPYHAALAHLLEEKRRRFGFAVLLCGHSMPSRGRRGHQDVGLGRADVVPGTRTRTTAAPGLIDVIDPLAAAHGLRVAHDDPYRGGFATQHWGRPAERIHAIQLELARRLYLDEDSHALEPEGLERTRAFVGGLCQALGAWRPPPP